MLVSGGRRAGKTTKALQWLDEQGGGIFITRHRAEATGVLLNVPLKNASKIHILDMEMKHMVVDDADHDYTYATYSSPLRRKGEPGLDKVVIAAMNYQAAKMYHQANPGDYSAMCAEDLCMELLEKAILEHQREE